MARRLVACAAIVLSALLCVGCAASSAKTTIPQPSQPATEAATNASATSAPADIARAEGLAYVTDGQVWRVERGVARMLTRTAEEKRSLAYSPDRTRLLFVSGDGMTANIVSLRVGSPTPLLVYATGQGSLIGAVRLDPATGDVLYTYYGEPYTFMRRIDARSRKPQLETVGEHPNGDFDFARDGSLVYASFEQDPARVIVRHAGAERALALRLSMATEPVFSADGTRLVLSGRSSQTGPSSLWVVDLASGGATQIKSTIGLEPESPAFSPQGAVLAFRSARDGALWLVGLDGGKPERLALKADTGSVTW